LVASVGSIDGDDGDHDEVNGDETLSVAGSAAPGGRFVDKALFLARSLDSPTIDSRSPSRRSAD
jgi:hypothetical protein